MKEVINGIVLTTSLGKTYAFGNYTSGNDYPREGNFSLSIPLGKKVLALAGGVSGYMNNIAVYYA